LDGGEQTETLRVGEKIKMTAAGLYNRFETSFDKVPGHTRGKGFLNEFTAYINQDGSVTLSQTTDVYFTHGAGLLFVWGFLGLLQITSNRYMKKYWSVAMWMHRISAGIIWLGTIYFSVLALKHNDWKL
jgi:hypothetical protein